MVEGISDIQSSAMTGQIQYAVLRESRDVQEQQGEAVLSMLQEAAEIASKGGKIEPGRLDLYA
jgi:hypothetical protein